MKLKLFLEEFITSIKSFEVFVNPTGNELKKFEGKVIRFIADCKEQKIYIFDATVLHYRVARELKFAYDSLTNKRYIYGIGKVKGNKVRIRKDEIESQEGSINFKTDWLEKYIK